MTKRNTTAYWLLLIGILLLVSLALLIRPTRSHYINTTVWNTAMYPASAPSSNCLVVGGQTILLGELPLTNEAGEALTSSYPFTLSEVGDGLTCSVDEGSANYLTAAVTPTEAGGALLLTPILTTAHEAVEGKVTVTWTVGETVLSGEFHVTVPEVVIATPPEGDSSGGDNSGGSENNPGGTQTDPNAGTSDDDTQQQTEDTTQDIPNLTPTVGAVNLTVKAPETYDPSGSLPVYLKVEGEWKALYLGMPKEDEDKNVVMDRLPPFTRYSLDGGETYTLLYNGGLIELHEDGQLLLAEGGTVLLDLSQTGLKLTESQTFYIQVYDSDLVQQGTFSAVAGDILPQERTTMPRVVTAAEDIQIPLPNQGESAKLTWTVSVRDINGAYTAVEDPAAIGLTVEIPTDENGSLAPYIQIKIMPQSEHTPAPGTYKLQLNWSWEGTQFAGTELTFFVNYVVDAQAGR